MYNDLTSPQFIYTVWEDAEDLEGDTLDQLFEAAHEVCVAFAPDLKGAAVPVSYKLAEIMQARHIYGQFRGGNRESTGSGEFDAPVYPLTFAARDLLRPKRSPLGRLGA